MQDFLQQTIRLNMTSPAKTVAPDVAVGDLLRLFGASACDAFPVTRGKELVGIVSRSDVLKPLLLQAEGFAPRFDEIMGTTVEEIMSPGVVAVEADATIQDLLDVMGTYPFESFPVIDLQRPTGRFISREECHQRSGTWRLEPFAAIADRARRIRDCLISAGAHIPAANAIRINSDTLRAPVLAIRLARYTSTVRGLMLSS